MTDPAAPQPTEPRPEAQRPPQQPPQSSPPQSSPPQPYPVQPYPVQYPPMPVQAAASRREGGFRRGVGRGAGAGQGAGASLLALALVGGLVGALLTMALAGALAGVGSTNLQTMRTLWGPASASGVLRAIEVNGPIMATPSDGAALTAATYGYEVAEVIDGLDAGDADGLVLLMNTPGGSINGSRAMADAVERYQQRTGKRAVAYVQGLSASGGMYTMAGADEIVADHGSLVGSIGVISGPFSRFKDVRAVGSTLFEQGVETEGGITQEYLTQGKGKDFGNPFREMGAEERASFMAFMESEYDNFVGWVSTHRKIPEATIRSELGAFIFGTEGAEANGLIDDTLGRDEAFRHFAEKAGLDPNNTKIVAPEPPSPWAQLLGVEARVYGQALPARPEAGQPARVTSTLCSGSFTVLAWHGDLASVCG